MNKLVFGRRAETEFSQDLKQKGHEILELNFRFVGGEIDIVSLKNGVIYFWEIKARHSTAYGYPEEAVNQRKIDKLKMGIEVFFLARKEYQDYQYRLMIAALVYKGDILVDRQIFEA